MDLKKIRKLQREGKLKAYRLECKLLQKQVADMLGVHERTYRRYENLEYIMPPWREC